MTEAKLAAPLLIFFDSFLKESSRKVVVVCIEKGRGSL